MKRDTGSNAAIAIVSGLAVVLVLACVMATAAWYAQIYR